MNGELHGEGRKPAQIVANIAKYNQARMENEERRETVKQRQKPCLAEQVKVNFGGTIANDVSKGGIGVVVWNASGKVMVALATSMQNTILTA